MKKKLKTPRHKWIGAEPNSSRVTCSVCGTRRWSEKRASSRARDGFTYKRITVTADDIEHIGKTPSCIPASNKKKKPAEVREAMRREVLEEAARVCDANRAGMEAEYQRHLAAGNGPSADGASLAADVSELLASEIRALALAGAHADAPDEGQAKVIRNV